MHSAPDSDKHDRLNQNIQSTGPRDVIQRLTQAFGKLPQVLAVVLGGSRAAATSDVASTTISTCTRSGKLRRFSRTLVGESAEIDNRFWNPATSGAIHPLARTSILCTVRLSGLRGKSSAFYRVTKLRSGIPPAFGTTSFIPKHYLTREVGIRDCRIVVAWRIRRAQKCVLRKNWPVLRRNPFIVSTPNRSRSEIAVTL